MTPEILLVFGILVVVIGVLAITGLVNPTETLAGFSNPAIVTLKIFYDAFII